MKAVYECKQSYLSLGYGDVNRYVPVMGVSYNDAKVEYNSDPHIVGYTVQENVPQRLEFYLFCEGENHNQITITDPKEIYNMREYIQRRHDDLITEVSFEGNEADLENPVESVSEETEDNTKKQEEGLDYEGLSDWDKEMLSRMSK